MLEADPPVTLSSYDLLEATAGWERLIAWANAKQCEVIAEFARRRPGPGAPDEPGQQVSEFAADEIAARLHITRRAADLKLSIALDLADRLPATNRALREGRIDLTKARAIADHTANLSDPAKRRAVEERVLARAGSQTAPELRRSLLRAVAAADSDAVVKRHAKAKAERFLHLHPLPDGMAEITAMLPADDATIVFTAADTLARCVDPDDPRGIDARRADALVDLCRPIMPPASDASGRAAPSAEPSHVLVGGEARGDLAEVTADAGRFSNTRCPACGAPRRTECDAAPRAADAVAHSQSTVGVPGRRQRRRVRRRGPQIQVTAAATTLLGLDDQPGELAGYGPIPADMARQIAADPDSTWRRLLTDPRSGVLLDYGITVYRPPPSLARHIRARDHVCAFPGCRQPAERCDLDHRERFPDGPTSADNLGPLCRHHHRAKTAGGWAWRRERDGTITWTAPTGHEYAAPTPAVLEACRDLERNDDDHQIEAPPF